MQSKKLSKIYFFRKAAGGFRIQNEGKPFVKKLVGDYENVIGLPLRAMCKILSEGIKNKKF